MLRLICSTAVVVAISFAPDVSADATGTWHGTLTGRAQICGAAVPVGGEFTLSLAGSGGGLTGTMYVPVWINVCAVRAAVEIIVVGVAGSSTGDSLSLTGTGSTRDGPVAINMNGSTTNDLLLISWSGAGMSGQGLASRAGSPPADFAGTWRGTATAAQPNCKEGSPPGPQVDSPKLFAPSIEIQLTQTGTGISGSARVANLMNDCGKQPSTNETHAFSANVDGHTVSTAVPSATMSATVSGGRMILFFAGSASTGEATLVRVAEVMTFSSSSRVVQPGQSVGLSWVTNRTSSVSIDNGVGIQPPSGSVLVTPIATTTYTLTAIGEEGSESNSSAVWTVHVVGDNPRRRSVRH